MLLNRKARRGFFGTPVEHPERGPGSTGQADCTGYTGLAFLVVVAENQAPDFLLRTILRRGEY